MLRFNNIPPIVEIGLWGPPSSGKTNYLVMLQFSEREGWNIRPGDHRSGEFFRNGTKLLIEERQFIPATPKAAGETFYPFEFEGPGILKRRTFRVFLPECAGEYYEYPSHESEFVKRICRSHGILWLVDPIQITNPDPNHKSYAQMIHEWLTIIYLDQGGGSIKKHMAFCLTKMDHPEHSENINNPRNYCLKLLGKAVRQALDDFCDPKKVSFYSTSAAGFFPGTTESVVDPNNNQQLLADPEPIGLFEPLSWLFSVI